MQPSQSAPIDSILAEIGRNLELLAKQAGLDRLKLADLTDLNRNTVSKALAGRDMKLSTLIRLTRALGHTSWLLPLIESPAPSPIEILKQQRESGAKRAKEVSSETGNIGGPKSRKMGRNMEES